MLTFETELWHRNVQYIAGVDEAGRGCLFGHVVAAAVILPEGLMIDGVDDSKKLTEKKRNMLYEIIREEALSIGIGFVEAREIDRINIKQASRVAMKQAVEGLSIQPEHLLVDAEHIETSFPQTAIVKGDQLSQSIAAASIIAKVSRDRMCAQWDSEYPGYGIAKHKGYGTKLHREKILEYGASQLHRKTFLKNIINAN